MSLFEFYYIWFTLIGFALLGLSLNICKIHANNSGNFDIDGSRLFSAPN